MEQYFANTLDALMMASDLGEFTEKEWDKLTAGMDIDSLRHLAQYGAFDIRKERVSYEVIKTRIFKLYNPFTSELVGETGEFAPAFDASLEFGYIIKEIMEENNCPIYQYWYTINPQRMSELFESVAE